MAGRTRAGRLGGVAEEEVEEEEEAEEKEGPEILLILFLQPLVGVWVLPNEYDSSGFFWETTSCAMLRSTVDPAPVRMRQSTVALGRISHSSQTSGSHLFCAKIA